MPAKTYISKHSGKTLLVPEKHITTQLGGQMIIQRMPQKPISFRNGRFTTSDQQEQEFIESNAEFGAKFGPRCSIIPAPELPAVDSFARPAKKKAATKPKSKAARTKNSSEKAEEKADESED